MKWLNGYKTRLQLIGFIVVIVLGGIDPADGAVIAVGSGAGYDFDTIQAGIDASSDGDTVLVAPGEYIITEPISFRGKAITVISETGPDETTIRMGMPSDTNRGSVVVFENNETDASILDGFTITGGTGLLADSGEFWGGGIFFNASSGTVSNCAIVQNNPEGSGGGVMVYSGSSATFIGCTISENVSPVEGYGGGVCCYIHSSAILTNCTIADNSAEQDGGGLFCYDNSSANLTDCTITGNSAMSAGGVESGHNSTVTMTTCTIRGNSANGTVPYVSGYGGGLDCWDNAYMIITNCTITENWAGVDSGGLFCAQSSVNMTDCIMTGNMAQRWCGGMECWHSSVTLTNCVIARNTAGEKCGGLAGAYSDSSLIITNCTIWGNDGGQSGGGVGCYARASVTVTNSILWGNKATRGREIFLETSPSVCNVTYSNIADSQTAIHVPSGCTLNWGSGNIEDDPLFVDPNNDDYHLKSQAGRWNHDSQTWIKDEVTSPCIDAGDPMSPIGWEPFPNGGFINMGAYGGTTEASKTYFGGPVCEMIVAGDINGDGQVNRSDLEIMVLHWTDDEPLQLP